MKHLMKTLNKGKNVWTANASFGRKIKSYETIILFIPRLINGNRKIDYKQERKTMNIRLKNCVQCAGKRGGEGKENSLNQNYFILTNKNHVTQSKITHSTLKFEL